MEAFKKRPHRLNDCVNSLPSAPGVYVLRDARGTPLYVGKSKCLSDRVSHYFRPSVPDRKTAHLRSLTQSIDFLHLGTDFEAREVEADLIRSYRPQYNTVYLDYMHRPLVKITTQTPFPKVEVVSERDDENARYFGPFRSTRRLRRILDILGECFAFRTCDYEIPEGGQPGTFERCHRYLLGRCNAPCVGDENSADYRDRLDHLIEFLKGDHDAVLDQLEQKMTSHADNHEYEAAQLIQEYRNAIQQLIEYEPFIRRTLDADMVHTSSETPWISYVKVRDHRVKDFVVHTRDQFDPSLLDEHARIVSDTDLPFSHQSPDPPETDEEHKLLQALANTVRSYNNQPEETGLVEDTIDRHGKTMTRSISGEDIGEMKLKGFSEDIESDLIEHYAHLIENGCPVPDIININGEQSVSADAIIDKALGRIRDHEFKSQVGLD